MLSQGLAALNLMVPPDGVERLLDYLALIQKWNRVYNLTALTDPHEMLTHHILDSLAALPALHRQLTALDLPGSDLRVLDVGSGAGLPGVVWAIVHPDWTVDCVDAVAKKAAFIQQAAVTLGLKRLRGLHARVEGLTTPYHLVCSRAFASLGDFAVVSERALGDPGVWLALKGHYPQEELRALPPQVQVFHVEQITVPDLGEQRCLVWMRRTGPDWVAPPFGPTASEVPLARPGTL